MNRLFLFLLLLGTVLVAGCKTAYYEHHLFETPENLAEVLAMKQRIYPVADAEAALQALVTLYLDLGFTFTQAEPELGLVNAVSMRDPDYKPARMVAAGLLTVAGLFTGSVDLVAYEDIELIQVSTTLEPVPEGIRIRVTMARALHSTDGALDYDTIDNPDFYTLFFSHVDKAFAPLMENTP